MSTKRLSKERLQALWAAFDVDAWGWSGWEERLLADLRWARETDAETLHSAHGQRALWSLTGMGTVGSAEHLSVEAALTDPAFVDALCALRERGLDAAPSRRAAELQAAYSALVARYRELSAGSFPRSRLVRAIHALRPQDLLCTYNDASTSAVRELLVGGRGQGFVEAHVLSRARLDDVLGPAHAPQDHAKRAMFGWWLYEHAEFIEAGGTPQPLRVAPEARAPDRVALPDFAALAQRFDQRCAARGLVFSRAQLLSLHTAWQFAEVHATEDQPTKRFAILSGLSGTGKTQLLQQYAHTVCELMELDPERHIAAVAVRPDWRDPTGLLGYLNALHAKPSFHAEPALRLVLAAVRSPHLPYFLLLDEMNLARPERYFAPFLSSMENGAPLQLHAQDDVVDGVPGAVRWPDNLRIGGSVNMDETTHPFSDKVLDRAFTLELWEVDLDGYFARRPNRAPDDAVVEALLLRVHALLRPIRRHFGYRTASEVLAWVAHARATPDSGVSLNELLDQAVLSKVLPRLRGTDDPSVKAALAGLRALCEREGLVACEAKLQSMAERLDETGVTGFWA